MPMAVCGHWESRKMLWTKRMSWPHATARELVLTVFISKYVEITHDYSLAAAKAFSTLHPESPFTFVYVSGEGATQKPGMFTPIFGRVKGQTEQALFDLGKANPQFKVYNVRPAGVDWRQHSEIHPFIPALPAWKKMLLGPIDLVYKNM